MKHDVTTMQTKRLIANALKKRMEKEPLSKITVSGIIADCGINRNTFYYHFEDIYSLLRWTLEQDTVAVIAACDLIANYEEAILYVLQYVKDNQHILACSYDAVGRAGLKRFFYDDFVNVIGKMIADLAERLQLSVPERFRKFACDFYTEAIAGMILSYIAGEYDYTEEELIDSICVIFKSSLPQMLIVASEKRKSEEKSRKKHKE